MAYGVLPTEDRLANLERNLAALADKIATRDGAERSRTLQVWHAVTIEPYGDAYPSLRGELLPVWTRDWVEDGGLWVPRNRHTSDQGLIWAASLWWCPPNTPVTILWDGLRYSVCAPPAAIHGRSEAGSVAAEWTGLSSPCDEYTVGEMTLRVFDTDGLSDEPQSYADDSPVTMGTDQGLVIGTEAVTAGKFCTAVPDRHGRWILVVEPCNLVCTEEEE